MGFLGPRWLLGFALTFCWLSSIGMLTSWLGSGVDDPEIPSATLPELHGNRHVKLEAISPVIPPKNTTVEQMLSLNGSPRLKIPYPIFVASLPKSGTTSIARMFYCGNVSTAHTFANTHDGRQVRIGECYQSNVNLNRAPFSGCGGYDVWSDNGLIRGKRCYYPSVHGLQSFYQWYPNSTILLIKRKKELWRQSVRNWKNGALVRKWRVCSSGFPPSRATDSQLESFYEEHATRIRDFVRARPSLSYVEIQLEDPDAGRQLEDALGIEKSCFKHHNSHEKRLRLNPKFRKEWEKKIASKLP